MFSTSRGARSPGSARALNAVRAATELVPADPERERLGTLPQHLEIVGLTRVHELARGLQRRQCRRQVGGILRHCAPLHRRVAGQQFDAPALGRRDVDDPEPVSNAGASRGAGS